MRPRSWPKAPELTAQVARAVAARGPYPLAMRIREVGESLYEPALVSWASIQPTAWQANGTSSRVTAHYWGA
ncbi:hypothetical protein GCM10010376_90880 [Streptomyces violaceusniger]